MDHQEAVPDSGQAGWLEIHDGELSSRIADVHVGSAKLMTTSLDPFLSLFFVPP